MLQLLSNASAFALGMAGLFTIGLTVFVGAVSDAILKDLGCGAALNGITAMSGAILGVVVQMAYFPQ